MKHVKNFFFVLFLFSLSIAAMANESELLWEELEVKTTVKASNGTRNKYKLEIESRDGTYRKVELESQYGEWNLGPAQLKMLNGCSLNSLKVYADPKAGIRFTLSDLASGKTFSCTPSAAGLTCSLIDTPKQQNKQQKSQQNR